MEELSFNCRALGSRGRTVPAACAAFEQLQNTAQGAGLRGGSEFNHAGQEKACRRGEQHREGARLRFPELDVAAPNSSRFNNQKSPWP